MPMGCWWGELRYQWGAFFFLFETLLPSVRAAGLREREKERRELYSEVWEKAAPA